MVNNKVELKDEELKEVSGGIVVNGITYKYAKDTVLKTQGSEETIIAKVLNYAVINGGPAYELDATKYFVGTTYTQTLQGTLEERFLDLAGYVPVE